MQIVKKDNKKCVKNRLLLSDKNIGGDSSNYHAENVNFKKIIKCPGIPKTLLRYVSTRAISTLR
jgi:hypothetical protein